MKFREFVGEDVKEKIKQRNWNEVIQEDILPAFEKETVDTPLGKTDKGFYDKVARQDKPYIMETSVGFGLSKMHLKRIFDYVKSWLIRYDIKYEAINPYLTVAKVEGNYKRDRFIKALKKVRENQVFEPEGVFLLREGDTDYIIIDYLYNADFVKKLDECISNFSLAKQENLCYIKLFSIDSESFPLNLFDEMVYSLPELPDVKAGNIGLLVRRR